MSVSRDRDRRRRPTHPGKVLEHYRDEEDLTQKALADRLGVPRQRISGIANRRRRITADTAHRLARVFDTTPEFWMNLQTKWDLWQEEDEKGDEFADLTSV